MKFYLSNASWKLENLKCLVFQRRLNFSILSNALIFQKLHSPENSVTPKTRAPVVLDPMVGVAESFGVLRVMFVFQTFPLNLFQNDTFHVTGQGLQGMACAR